MASQKRAKRVGLVLSYLVLSVAVVVVVFPVIWLIGGSLTTGSALYSGRIFPGQITLEHFQALFSAGSNYPRWYLNTLKISLANCALSVTFTTITAYTFSRYRFAGRRVAMMAILVIQMFPGIVGMVALHAFLNLLGMLDTHRGLILVYSAGQIPFNTWLTKGYLDSIPREVDEAAQIDGAGHFIRFFRIILPLARPIVGTVALFTFFGPFFDYIFPRIILRSPENWTLGVGLWNIMAGRSLYNSMNNFSQFAAGALLVAIPCTAAYLIFQRRLISGLAMGATR
jgi:arabinogalactan oligomer/maltooligosaccharide transport system permease protein